MGPYYEIDEETMTLHYQDASTNWQMRVQAITQEQLKAALDYAEKCSRGMDDLLKSFVQEVHNEKG